MQARSQPMRHLENIAIFGRVATGSYTPQMSPTDAPLARSKRSGTIDFLDRQVDLPGDGDVTYDTELPINLRFYDFEPREKITFPTQKPIAMGVDLVRTYARPGDTILDICVGSGTNAIAAIRCGHQFIAYERDEKHFQIACDRIRATERDESDQVAAADSGGVHE
jgi:site-specific DNA-methyltransferase (adenine-specific)